MALIGNAYSYTPYMNKDWLELQGAYEIRALEAQSKAAQAFARLLDIAAQHSGQADRVRRFIAASFNGDAHRFDLFDLRALDVEISDDVLTCIDALRWGRADLYRLVPNGLARVEGIIRDWGVGKSPAVNPDI